MPGKKRDISRSENPETDSDPALLSAAEEREILDEVLRPRLRELLAMELEVALNPTNRDGSIVRGRLIDRLIGKPAERKSNTTQPKIVVNLLQVGPQNTPQISTQVVSGELVEPQPEELPNRSERFPAENLRPQTDFQSARFGYDQAEISQELG